MNPYRRRILDEVLALWPGGSGRLSVLDFGSGDGWFALALREAGVVDDVTCVDVKERANSLVKPTLYDGGRLPFGDRSFDLVLTVDVLHHCPSPRESLRELLRCSRRYALIKDHTYHTLAGWLTLCILDELGNRRFGVPSAYRYQRRWDWLPWFEEEGFAPVRLVHPALVEPRPWGRLTNRLQFLGLWERGPSGSGVGNG